MFLVYIKFNLLGNLAQTKNYIKSFATQISLYLCKYSQFFMNKNLNKEESFLILLIDSDSLHSIDNPHLAS